MPISEIQEKFTSLYRHVKIIAKDPNNNIHSVQII